MDLPAEAVRANSLILYLFVLFKPSMDQLMLTSIGEGDLYSDYCLKC